MFFFRKLLLLVFICLLIFGLFGVYGRSAGPGYESAYRQGFIDGQQAAAGGAESAAPGTQIYYRGHDYFFPAPGLLLCLIPLFAIGFMMMAAGKHRHGRHRGWTPCGPGHGSWKHGPWEQWGDSPKEKSPDDIDDGPDETIRYA